MLSTSSLAGKSGATVGWVPEDRQASRGASNAWLVALFTLACSFLVALAVRVLLPLIASELSVSVALRGQVPAVPVVEAILGSRYSDEVARRPALLSKIQTGQNMSSKPNPILPRYRPQQRMRLRTGQRSGPEKT